jgi:hypothetical protein
MDVIVVADAIATTGGLATAVVAAADSEENASDAERWGIVPAIAGARRVTTSMLLL